MNTITVTSLGGAVWIIWTILVCRLMRLPSQKKRYQKMNDQKLIDYNVKCSQLRNTLVALAIVVALALIFILSIISDSDIRTYLAFILIVLLVAAISGFLIFREITKITQSEIVYREERGGTSIKL